MNLFKSWVVSFFCRIKFVNNQICPSGRPSYEMCQILSNNMATTQGARTTKHVISWTDSSISLLLDALKTRESLWNSKLTSYRDRNIKKREYQEIVTILSAEIPEMDLSAVKGNSIQNVIV